MTTLASITATIILTVAIVAVLLYLHPGPIDTRVPLWMPGIRGSRIRILSGAHANHFGDIIRRDRRRAMVRLRTGVCVWVEDGEWVRVGGGE
jgi:hypothetical protein